MKRVRLLAAWCLDALPRAYRGRCRALDVAILWPSIKDQAPDIGTARCAFRFHAMKDPVWTKDMSQDMIQSLVEALI